MGLMKRLYTDRQLRIVRTEPKTVEPKKPKPRKAEAKKVAREERILLRFEEEEDE